MKTDLKKWIHFFQEVNQNKRAVIEKDYWQVNLMRDIRKLKNWKGRQTVFSGIEADLNQYLWKWALLCIFFAAFIFLYGSLAGGSMYGYLYSSLFVDPYTSMLSI